MTKKLKKEIGDTTSFTIPKVFVHTKTMREIEVNDAHLNFISKNLEDRKLVHAILSAVHDYINFENQHDEKLDEIINELKSLKHARIVIESNVQEESETVALSDVTDILGGFGE